MLTVTNFGMYFFLIIGLVFLFLIAYQFGLSQTKIFTIIGAFPGSFAFVMLILVFIKKLRKAVERKGKILSYMTDISFTFLSILVFSISILIIVEALFEIKNLSESYIKLLFVYVYPILGLLLGILILSYPIEVFKRGTAVLYITTDLAKYLKQKLSHHSYRDRELGEELNIAEALSIPEPPPREGKFRWPKSNFCILFIDNSIRM